jgi:ATP-dependent RNA helicase DDX54/DBP10
VHHILEVGLNLRTVEYIVFDEADRLFEMGLMDQIQQILAKLPETKQSLLFSATLPEQLVEFAKIGLNNPQLIRLNAEIKLPETLKMGFFTLRVEDKPAALLHFIRNIIPSEQQTIIFTSTRHHVEYLNELLTHSGFSSSVVYGSMDHTARKINVTKFRAQQTQYLIVTDVAARGIDLPLLDNVINYDFPPTSKLFVHRAGRVARMGRTGFAYSFVAHDELPYMLDLYLFLARKPVDTLPENTPFSDSDVYYGKIPQEPLDNEHDVIRSLHKQHLELVLFNYW